MYVSAFGPKTMALAGELGDGIVLSIPPDAAAMDRVWANVDRGAAAVGRELDRTQYLSCSLTMVALLRPGETLDSERVRREVGPMVVSSIHYVYDRVRQLGGSPPGRLHDVWDRYCAMVEAVPEEIRHNRIHAGHCTYVLPEEEELLTPELIKEICIAGTPEEIIDQVRKLEASGLEQIMLLPSLETQYGFLHDVATQVMEKM
jgi:alkanesulfonate monooxygenase SsuD/methylene tetrahydromethanopterin reductase-like flavin-dependent oxidoreductase (luciferase family)